MSIKNKVILIISPQKWGEVKVSKHYYALELAKKENTILFLNPPDPSCKHLSISDTEHRLIKHIDYEGFIKGLNFFPRFIKKVVFKNIFHRLERLIAQKIDVIWSFDNSVFYDFSAIPSRVLKISHIVDFNQHFNIERSSITADICLGSTRHIVKRSEKFNKNSYFIHHGYLPSSNDNSVSGNEEKDDLQLTNANKLKACYAGNLDIKYIDWSLIEDLVDRFKNVDFIFAGPWEDGERKKFMLSKANFFYEGVIPSNQLPNLYDLADILIITYKYREFPKQLANPHKMMGYLGTGKMIISTWSEEYSELNDAKLILMAKDKDECIQYFGNAIDNLSFWSSGKQSKGRREYALDNTYSNQIKRIEKIIYT